MLFGQRAARHAVPKVRRIPMSKLTRAQILLVLLMMLVAPSSVRAQSHFNSCVSRTGSNAHLLIPAEAKAGMTIGGVPISVGDELAAITPEGVCAGALVWTDDAQALAIWGDDSFTSAKESFVDGDPIRLVFWDASAKQEYQSVDISLSAAQPFYSIEFTYEKNALYLLDALTIDVEAVAPVLEAPVAAARAVETSPLLTWTRPSESATFDVQVSTDADFKTIAQQSLGLANNQLRLSDLQEGTTYYWRVRAVIGGTASDYATSSFTTQFSQKIDLVQGWNLISSRITPTDANLDEIYSGLGSSILMVKNGSGGMYSPEFDINTIGAWSPSQGYQVYATKSGALVLKGDAVPADAQLQLENGWNTFAYWPTAALDAPTALASISANIVLVKNGAGEVWLPEFGVNTMGAMRPGAGYLVHLTKASKLTYPAAGASKTATDALAEAESAPIGSNATLVVLAPEVNDGVRIAARRADGSVVGAGTISDGRAVVVLRGDDDVTAEVQEGALIGEGITIEVQSADRVELQLDPYRDLLSGQMSDDLVYQDNGAWVVTARLGEASANLPMSFELEQNYPNPFNPSTSISYSLPKEAHVRLEVFNALGQRVRTLVDATQAADQYQVQFDATNLPSGVYFYTLKAGEHHAVRQMLLLK